MSETAIAIPRASFSIGTMPDDGQKALVLDAGGYKVSVLIDDAFARGLIEMLGRSMTPEGLGRLASDYIAQLVEQAPVGALKRLGLLDYIALRSAAAPAAPTAVMVIPGRFEGESHTEVIQRDSEGRIQATAAHHTGALVVGK